MSLGKKTSRIKQIYSIVAKLRRGRTRLSSVDDIAGCRAVVERETDVNALVLQDGDRTGEAEFATIASAIGTVIGQFT